MRYRLQYQRVERARWFNRSTLVFPVFRERVLIPLWSRVNLLSGNTVNMPEYYLPI